MNRKERREKMNSTVDNLILSIETSSSNCSIAISNNGDLLSEYNIYSGNMHDVLLAENVKKLLSDLDYSIGDLSAVAVSAGPGSFTGLRVGVSFAKGLCFDGSIKLISVPTMSSLSLKAGEYSDIIKSSRIITIIKSHQDLFYYQMFDNNAISQSEIIMADSASLNKLIMPNDLICGTDLFSENTICINDLNTMHASYISNYAYKEFEKGVFTDTESFEPMYIQEFSVK